MEFALMQIKFPDPNLESLPSTRSNPREAPAFFPLKTFKMTGLVMNVFLLDPVARLLSGFIWIVSSSTIGLFVLPDWNRDEYVFVDTKIPCVSQTTIYLTSTSSLTFCLHIKLITFRLRFHRIIGRAYYEIMRS